MDLPGIVYSASDGVLKPKVVAPRGSGAVSLQLSPFFGRASWCEDLWKKEKRIQS